MESLVMFGGLVVGALIHGVERRIKIQPGVLLVVYLAGWLVGILMGV